MITVELYQIKQQQQKNILNSSQAKNRTTFYIKYLTSIMILLGVVGRLWRPLFFKSPSNLSLFDKYEILHFLKCTQNILLKKLKQ